MRVCELCGYQCVCDVGCSHLFAVNIFKYDHCVYTLRAGHVVPVTHEACLECKADRVS